MLDLKKIETAY